MKGIGTEKAYKVFKRQIKTNSRSPRFSNLKKSSTEKKLI